MIEKDLELISSEDEDEAREAFDRVIEDSTNYVRSVLFSKFFTAEQIDDLVQDAFLKVWSSRKRFKPMGRDAALLYFRKAAIRCGIDLRIKQKQITEITLEDIERLPAFWGEIVENVLVVGGKLKDISFYADELWIGFDRSLSARDRGRAIFAAQMFYVDSKPWEEVLSILGETLPTRKMDRTELDTVLRMPEVLRKVVYKQLCITNEHLARYLLGDSMISLGPKTFVETPVTDQVVRQLIVFRFRYAFLMKKIDKLDLSPLDSKNKQDIVNTYAYKMPYSNIMQDLLERMRDVPELGFILGHDGLWKRLVYQYGIIRQLPQDDIRDRCEPAARLVGVQITSTTVADWISHRRLLTQLERYTFERIANGR